MMNRRQILRAGVFAGAASLARAQRDPQFDHSVVNQMRIDARDLGYPPVDVIPSGECAVRALAVAPSGAIYGATSGHRSHLFVLHPLRGYVQPLGYLEGATTIHHSVVVSNSGDVYIGGSIGVDNNGEGYHDYAGGHLLKYTPGPAEESRMRVEARCEIADLGIPVPGDGVYSLVYDGDDAIYGLSYPRARFFRYSIVTARTTVLATVAEHSVPGEKFEKDRNIGRALAMQEGKVVGSGEDGRLFRYSPGDASVHKLAAVPSVPGREPYDRVDAWCSGPNGLLYGGTSDGYLFRLKPDGTLENLGKPLNQYRIRGLVRTRSGKLYGAGGDDDEMARLFSYDPGSGVYEVLGFIDVNRRPYYTWQAYVIDAMAIGKDGTVYLGQSERRSLLYVYHPE